MFKMLGKIKKYKLEIETLNTQIENLKRDQIDAIRSKEAAIRNNQYDYEIQLSQLRNELKLSENRFDNCSKELIQYKDADLDKLFEQIDKLKIELKESNANNLTLDLQKANNEIEVLKAELHLKNKLVKELSNLPDVKRMIDNVANLRVPAIDEMKEIFSLFDGSKMTEMVKEISNLKNYIMESRRYDEYGGYGNKPRF